MARYGPQFGPDITFLGVPRCTWDEPETYADADVVILGAPFDGGTSHRPGTRFGPQHIRQTCYLPHDGSRPSLALRVDGLSGDLTVYDAGDVEMFSGDAERSVRDLQRAVHAVTAAGAVPLVLGGDHTVAWPDAAGVAQHLGQGRVSMIHFDAHADTGDVEFGPPRRGGRNHLGPAAAAARRSLSALTVRILEGMEEARRRRWYADGLMQGHETLVERQIRLAHERGDFDDLPGKGKPLPGLDGPDDEDWWVKGYLRREGLSSEPLLPTPLQLRREIERLPETLSGLPDEQAVRGVVRELNRRIAEWVRAPVGPAVPVGPVDVDAVVARWHADRTALRDRRAAERRAADAAARADRPRRRWWRW